MIIWQQKIAKLNLFLPNMDMEILHLNLLQQLIILKIY